MGSFPCGLRRVLILLQQLATLPSVDVEEEFREWASDAKLVIPDHANVYIGIRARTVSSFIARIGLATQLEFILKGMWQQKAIEGPLDLTAELDESLVEWKSKHLALIGSQPEDTIPSHLLMLRMVIPWRNLLVSAP